MRYNNTFRVVAFQSSEIVSPNVLLKLSSLQDIQGVHVLVQNCQKFRVNHCFGGRERDDKELI